MDETDTGPTGSATAAEAARERAAQRRARARSQFDTPSRIGSGSAPATDTTSLIPQQVEPEHDEIDLVVQTQTPDPADPIPAIAHWAERARPRRVAGTLLVLAVAGAVTSLVLTITTQSVGAISGLVACAFVAVIFRGALMGSGVTTVDLTGARLRIRKGGVQDEISLLDPVHRIELVGTPDQHTWRLRLEAIDGRTIELGPRQVDAPELHRIVEHYREIAGREKRDRERRYNR